MKPFYIYESKSCSRILCRCSENCTKPTENYLAPDVHHKLNLTLQVVGRHWLFLEMEKPRSKHPYIDQVPFVPLLLCFSCLSGPGQVDPVAQLTTGVVLPEFKVSSKQSFQQAQSISDLVGHFEVENMIFWLEEFLKTYKNSQKSLRTSTSSHQKTLCK